ncbi:L,D-transpeptidase family protein [Costertonia aggregata]|uniref:L,D-transpeptidase n=1 Tax=Costertonia aggregata TaxID=343403 RepID=A0A7H9ATS7_9FLAO|nr:L,D-transpeptidase [Costertonia aggregata]QLG46891.1 L,D-transpeptidase [Costertonia aggregata]
MKTLLKSIPIGFCLICLGFQTFQITCSREKEFDAKEVQNERTFPESKTLEPSILLLLDSLQLKKEDISIHIDKSDYRLYAMADTVIVKTYPVVFGTNPVDDKLMQGDRSTPEGGFSVRAFYPHTTWSKFIWIDYPTTESWEKHNKAKAENKIPKDAKIGGEIGIHGVPKGHSNLIKQKQNWTWGCISLTNKDVNDLYTVVYRGMPITITK